MKLLLPHSVYSPQDVASLTMELRQYASWFSHNTIKHDHGSTTATVPPFLSPSALELIRQVSKTELLDQTKLDQLVEAIDILKKKSETITITLAALPSDDLKTQLVTWCRETIHPTVLVTFNMNRAILGGLVVRYRSHIFDWSFRRTILTGAQDFAKVLRRV
jgi:hypothetical protein